MRRPRINNRWSGKTIGLKMTNYRPKMTNNRPKMTNDRPKDD